jgi:hypothetical protein
MYVVFTMINIHQGKHFTIKKSAALPGSLAAGLSSLDIVSRVGSLLFYKNWFMTVPIMAEYFLGCILNINIILQHFFIIATSFGRVFAKSFRKLYHIQPVL